MTPPAPVLAHQAFHDWIVRNHGVDIFRLTELAIADGGLPEGPFETAAGELITPIQILARWWEGLGEERSASMAFWLLDSYPDTQVDPASLGELLAAVSRPVFGPSHTESQFFEAEQSGGLDQAIIRCESLLELLPVEEQELAHQAMIRSARRSLEQSLKDGKYQAIRRWVSSISMWFTGRAGYVGPEMPGYFSWEQERGSPFSKEAARLLHEVFQLVDDDQVLGNTFALLMPIANLLTPADELVDHGIEGMREAREDLARYMLLDLDGPLAPGQSTSRQAFPALVGINAVMVLMETSDLERQRNYHRLFADVWPVFEAHARHLSVYQNERIGLRKEIAEKLFSQMIPRAEKVLAQIRSLSMDQQLPGPAHTAGIKPRF